MRLESLEDRRLLAVSFEFNYIGGNGVGFNDPVEGPEFRSALESAASRLGGWMLHDATVQLDVHSFEFTGSAVAHASSAIPPSPATGGFLDTIIGQKIKGLNDANGATSDGEIEVFFFDGNDPFTYVTDPTEVDADNELDFQALVIHELAHSIGFTSATNADGTDDDGNGVGSPGTWRPYDRFLSDVDGNRLIDADPLSATAFQMDATGWSQHSVGGKGPDAGLFFDGPKATAVYGARVPLYSPAAFSLSSSVSHLDSEGAPDDSIFSPTTHLMSHATIDLAVPQEFTLVEKAIFADIGINLIEDTLPEITPPQDITLEGNTSGGFSGTNAALTAFLDGAIATDLFDDDVTITNDAPSLFPLGQTTVVFTATDDSGNEATATARVRVVDTASPVLSVTPTVATLEATGPFGVLNPTLPFSPTVSDVVDASPSLVFSSRSTYPLGTTVVTYTAEDSSGNQAAFPVSVVVEDTTPPDFSMPSTLTIPGNVPGGADLNNSILVDLFDSLASDIVDRDVAITASPSTFPVGQTNVTFTATDDFGNSTDVAVDLTVSGITYTVTTLDDELDADPGSAPQDLSLREAISLANATVGSDEIRFDPSLNGTVVLSSALGALQINDGVSIIGNGRDDTIIDGNDEVRVFDVSQSGGNVQLLGLTITGGLATGEFEFGGGIRFLSGDTLTIESATFTDNHSIGLGAAGGAIYALGTVEITDSILSDNSTTSSFGGGGALYHAGDITITRSVVTGNRTNNELAAGGGAYISEGEATIIQSTFTDNQTAGERAGGAGLVVLRSTVTIRDSTISGNMTSGSEADGAGIQLINSPTTIINSTISGNTASGEGGGLYIGGRHVSIHNSTVTSNVAAERGGGITTFTQAGDASFSLDHSIVAGNSDDGTAPDFLGTRLAAGNDSVIYSLVGDNTGTTLGESQTAHPTTGSLIGDPNGGGLIDPQLSALADNGGPTQTHLPLQSSPVLDAGDPQFNRSIFTPPLDNDQRGVNFPRIAGGNIDIGSVERPTGVTINWADPAPIVFGTALSATQLNATADVTGTFVYTPALGTILNAGDDQQLSVEFTPDDLVNFEVTTATVFIDVLREDPVITWDTPDPIDFGTPLSATQLDASADVPGTFSYTPDLGAILASGDGRVLSTTFTPVDTTNFNVVSTSVFIDVLKGVPVVTWADPDPIVFGTALSSTQLNATADVDGTFSYIPPAGIFMLPGNNQTLSVTFTPTDATNFESVTETVQIDVLKADPVITWNDPADIIVGTALGTEQLNAEASVSGTFEYDPNLGTVLSVGDGQTLSVTFTPDLTSRFNVVQATVSINVLAPQDYGDAPDAYPVTLAEDGARHTTTSLRLGDVVSNDFDGTPSAAADSDDDDGITFLASLVSDGGSVTTSSLSADVSETGKLDGWIDFNQDGDWDDAGEQILSSVDVAAGGNTLSFTIPAGASIGDTAARLRLSSAGGLLPTGAAADGEVEDYIVTILDGSQAPDVLVTLLNASVAIDSEGNDVVVESGGVELFAAPQASVGALSVTGTAEDDTVDLHAAGGTLPAGGLSLDGNGGDDTLRLIGNAGVFDLTDPNIQIDRFNTLDLSSSDAVTLVVDAAAIARLSPITRSVFIAAGEEDVFDFEDVDSWLLTDPAQINDRFIQTATNSDTGEIVQVEQPDHWRNFLRAGDVNNDGAVTARDALRIINELGRRNFSDDETQTLVDAATLTPWPDVYFDHNGDGRVSALDALRVINELARISNVVDGELVVSLEDEAVGRTNVDTLLADDDFLGSLF